MTDFYEVQNSLHFHIKIGPEPIFSLSMIQDYGFCVNSGLFLRSWVLTIWRRMTHMSIWKVGALSAKQKESNHYQGRVEVSHLLTGRVDWFWRLERLNLTRQLAYSRPVERSRVVCFYHYQHHHSLASWKICGRPTFPFSCPGSWGRELVSISTKQLIITIMTWWLLDNFKMTLMMMMTTKLNQWWPDDSNGCKEGMVNVLLTGWQRQWGVLG